MKRTPLTRKTPLRAKTQLRSKTRIKPVNRSRKSMAFERNYGDRGAKVREMECLLSGADPCGGAIQAAHVVARGMGGCNGDRRSLVPLCAHHHSEQGTIGIKSWQEHHGVDLKAEAARLAAELDDQGVD